MNEEEMYPICQKCHHSMSMHIGPTDMGGGNIEPMGCTHVIDYDKQILCDCMNYDKDFEEW